MRAPGPLRVLGPRRFDLRFLAQDLPLKAVALGVAAVLWVTVAQAAGREVTVEFDGRIPVERPEVPEGHVLRGALGDVAVKLRGTPAALAAISRESLRATIDISVLAATRGEPQEAPVRVTVASDAVKVVDATPASVPVRVEKLTTRTLPVQARYANEAPRGFTPGDATVTPPEVTVSGPESAVAAVAAVYATVRFGDVGLDLVQAAQATPVDKDGAPVDGVTAEPAAVQVGVPLLPTSTTRTLPVFWDLRGSVAAGYWISRVTTEPAAVTVRGEPATLSGLERVSAAPVDVSGLTASRTVRVALVLPAGVQLLQPLDASVTVTVTPLTGTRPFPLVAVQAVGLAANQVAEIDPRTIEVIVGG
ncbi:MAG TPA: CdaR family protein, partial [Candidatus Limnocylindria bacterium]|nr:CdaR family protein [Candidatus Limnocylindria bacterium]